MASILPIRRPLATLAARAAKQPFTTGAVLSTSFSIPNLSPAAPRSLATSRVLPLPPRHLRSQTTRLAPRALQQQSIRRQSDDASQQQRPFRSLKFEDINAALPADPSAPPSPPATPQKKLILVDVREPAELISTGIIPSAVAVPLASQPDALFLSPDEFETRFGFPKPAAHGDDQIVFYCKAGVRARTAAQLAVQAGYDADRIGVYEGSWLDWADKGGRVQKWEGELE
ncbi:rhodanese-like domain-containing protein [Aspergillus clavatus NRRL 1]|uniref:Rhodanese domain protein n=1 Tax=Aspergillus clavatus (strain ATCC 1007 / CBS 513.65 / DSM 816 / NCTC 3887 / NRRL 1 / QM 1276 / 107) TaxID=344612 RepID=A1CRQ9_ASPCL|nr:Rhodanese domain protein [Aspergillus clavatus NRRL 1]EAW08330.1 Rhodanese domain protein [Aspergillus clavatus NRRL 1]